MGTIADTRDAPSSTTCARRAGAVGCVAVTSFRPVPGRGARERRSARAGAVAVVERTDEPAAARQPADPRGQGRALSIARPTGAPVPRVRSVVGRARLARRRRRATSPPSSTGWPTDRDPAERRYATLGHPPSARARQPRRSTSGPTGAFSLRGHSIGGFGSVTTNKLVATLVGELFGLYVQAYPRYGSEKKGLPTTYYLTIADERDPPARGARARRLRAAPRRGGLPPGRPARAAWPTAGRSSSSRRSTDPERDLGIDPSRMPARTILARGIRLAALDTAGARAPPCAAPGPRPADAGRRAGRRLPAPDAVRGTGRARTATTLLERGPASTRAVLRQARRRASSTPTSALIADAYDGVIDVTAPITALIAAPQHALAAVAAT